MTECKREQLSIFLHDRTERKKLLRSRRLINGVYDSQTDSNVQVYTEVFFLFTKILRELCNALAFRCIRVHLTNEKDIIKKFETPKPRSINPIPDLIGSCRIQPTDKIQRLPIGFRLVSVTRNHTGIRRA
jgi:hypothetical protein